MITNAVEAELMLLLDSHLERLPNGKKAVVRSCRYAYWWADAVYCNVHFNDGVQLKEGNDQQK